MSAHFGISWIYEEFHAVRMDKDKCIEDWRSPTPVSDLGEFSEALNKACKALGMRRGGDVAIAYESDEHAHSFLDIPPMSESDMEKYLSRRVEEEKQFTGPAAWGYRCSDAKSQGRTVLLHVMPASIRDAIMRICEENYVIPRRLLPLTDVMAQHVVQYDTEHSENALLIALFDSRIEMVVLNDNGSPMFVRELGFHWNSGEMERLRTDVERTLLFAKQRLSSQIKVVSLMGVEAIEAASQLQKYFDIEILADKLSLETSFWAAEVNRLPKRTKSNFIPRSMQRAITSRQLKSAAKRMVLAASVAALIVVASVEYFVFQFNDSDNSVEVRIDELKSRHQQLLTNANTIEKLQQQLLVLQQQELALPIVFLERLGDLMPQNMVASEVSLKRQSEHWTFSVKGFNNPTLVDTASSLTLLEQRMSAPPWNAKVSRQWREEWLKQLRTGQALQNEPISFQLAGEFR